MMRTNQQLVHGADLESFKFLPKFLGVCLRRLSQLGSVRAADFLQWHRRFKSLEVESGSLAPIKLKNIRHDLLKDDWSSLESEEDANVLLEGIFEFLKSFSHDETTPTDGTKGK